jgi:hypothetical protein
MVVSNVNVPEATDLDDFLVQPEHWLKSWWRPLMAIQYMVICLFDFIVGPYPDDDVLRCSRRSPTSPGFP